jgi:NAD(P)-dependent dehydrogenase (short-subunit alcohol dehydrogenase family)
VITVARDPERGAATVDEIRQRVPTASVETLTADLSSLVQVRRLADEVLARHDRIDVLVNNAGVITMRPQTTVDGLEATFATNHLAPFLLTNLLRGLLQCSAPARVVTVASAVHKQIHAIPWDDMARGVPGGHGRRTRCRSC